MISLTNHDSSEGEQWGRYNLPRPTGKWSSSIHSNSCPDLAWRTFTGLRMRSERVTRVWLHKAFSKSLCGAAQALWHSYDYPIWREKYLDMDGNKRNKVK